MTKGTPRPSPTPRPVLSAVERPVQVSGSLTAPAPVGEDCAVGVCGDEVVDDEAVGEDEDEDEDDLGVESCGFLPRATRPGPRVVQALRSHFPRPAFALL